MTQMTQGRSSHGLLVAATKHAASIQPSAFSLTMGLQLSLVVRPPTMLPLFGHACWRCIGRQATRHRTLGRPMERLGNVYPEGGSAAPHPGTTQTETQARSTQAEGLPPNNPQPVLRQGPHMQRGCPPITSN